MLKYIFLVAVLPYLCLGNTRCQDGITSCPEGKTCCENEGSLSCCKPGYQPVPNRLSRSPMISNTSAIQNSWSSSTPGFCTGTMCFDGSCCPYYQAACCGGGRCCQQGSFCCGGGQSCCQVGSQCCAGGGLCCPSTTPCCGVGCCPYGTKCCGSAQGQWCCQNRQRCGSGYNTCY